jgi:hypothetical protein
MQGRAQKTDCGCVTPDGVTSRSLLLHLPGGMMRGMITVLAHPTDTHNVCTHNASDPCETVRTDTSCPAYTGYEGSRIQINRYTAAAPTWPSHA